MEWEVNEFRKDDSGKPALDMLSLLPPKAAVEVAKAFEYGGKKYGFDNYLRGTNWRRYTAAALRHIWAWLKGETNDPESGLNHLTHAAASILIVLTLQLEGLGTDDRFVTVNATSQGASSTPQPLGGSSSST